MNLFNAEISEIILDYELGNFLPRILTLGGLKMLFVLKPGDQRLRLVLA